ncbi:MAG TPA: phosphomevalonate kinase [Oscillatoriaceae cyanobacterium]
MPHALLRLRAPGKLMIAGEYAVLEPHQPSLVAAVDRYVNVEIALSPENLLSVPDWGIEAVRFADIGGEVRFTPPEPRLRFVERALAVTLAHLREQFLLPLSFHLTITSELESPDGRKIGLGSSAAVVVAVVAAVLHLLGDEDEGPVSPDLVFKLAAIAHFQAQGSGSGADVAASTYGGWLRYSSFQPDWLRGRLDRRGPLYKLLDENWPFLSVTPLEVPSDLCLCVGWTGEPASTGPMITRVQSLRATAPEAYGNFLKTSAEAVEALIAALQHGEASRALAAIAANRVALQRLGEAAAVQIETPGLSELSRWAEVCGGSAKPSGAGGGDCGVALIEGAERAVSLQAAWRKAGIEPLDLAIAETGVTVTRVEA